MEFREKRLTIAEAREKDIVSVLSGLGNEPTKITRNDHWYHSPLRDERTPSFKVNRRLNRWYDHGIGQGGNLVDFAVLYWDCSVSEALQKLSENFSLQQPFAHPVKIVSEKDAQIKILGAYFLSSPALLSYLNERCITAEVASHFCREVRFELAGKTWYGIGFKNDVGGYEIRNAFQKLSSSPKDITSIKNGNDTVVVFEGFFDFLSFMTITGQASLDKSDFIILNSLAFLRGFRPVLDSYKNVHLFLDSDAAGKKATQLALSWGRHYHDASNLYNGYEDLNAWLIKAANQVSTFEMACRLLIKKPPDI